MSKIRLISKDEVRHIKSATASAFILGSGPAAFAPFTRVNVSMLSRYQDNAAAYEELVVPLDVAIEADRHAGQPVLIAEAAKILGYGLAALDDAGRAAGLLSERDAHTLLGDAADVTRTLLDALADGRIDAAERKQLRRAFLDLLRDAQEGLEKLDARPGELKIVGE